jgi:hypothetical protein
VLARLELDDELAVERVRNAKQGVDARRPPAALEARDRRLGRSAKLRELALREAFRHSLLGDSIRYPREEPAAIARNDSLVEPLDRPFLLCT